MVHPTLTVDVGTTSVKLCVFDADAGLIATAKHATPTALDDAGEIYDVPALLDVVGSFIKDLPAAQRALVERIALTGVGESGGLVRGDLSPASPMVLWHDQRGVDRLRGLSLEDRSLVYRVTGLPVSGNYALSKTAWAVDRAGGHGDARWLNIAEHLAAVMTGERWSEPSLASRTMALDLSTRTWSPEVCALVGLDVGVFPELRSAAEGTPVTPAYAASVGLSTDVVVHVAGHDHMVGGVGADLRPGELLNSTGTTEGLLLVADAPTLDGHAERSKLANGLACAGPGYTLFASIPTGGSAFATLQGMLGLDAGRLAACVRDLHARYLEGRIDLGAVPLVLPQFRGSPPPTKDPAARGLVAGLRTGTTAEDLVLGCFLGLALQLGDVLELFRVAPRQLKVIGPASGNPLWLQLKADLLGIPLSASGFGEVVSRGAQALASGTTGVWAETGPYDVLVDPVRHARLIDWRAAVRPRWEHLKATPS
ncbi:FGGY-family carbohydrate kinase [Microlunatus antarcticus]|uniref:Sugar (Pentulose or hexulose) kinase n=1 Tax=Microlunatus antarcticus TaxID=53388 RepID=A0A7W5P7S2_9ACTN|nr:sugar (pentulose or hexulose) kinase [Microlunatus antarcticus]